MSSNVGFMRLKALMERGYTPNWTRSYGSDIELVHPLSCFLTVGANGSICQSEKNIYIDPEDYEKFESFISSVRKPTFLDKVEFFTKIKLIISIYTFSIAVGLMIEILAYYVFKYPVDFLDAAFSAMIAASPFTFIVAVLPPAWRRSHSWFR